MNRSVELDVTARPAPRRGIGGRALALTVALSLGPALAEAQVRACTTTCPSPMVIPGAAPVPFGPGEMANYELEVGWAGGGRGSMSVVGIELMQGNPTYHVRMEMKGRVALLYSLHNIYDSWIDVRQLYARRFIQYQDETGYDRHRLLDFFPHAQQWWYRSATDTMRIIDRGELASAEPLDDISFVFFARTLPLDVGDEYSFDRYWRDTGNPVTLKVLRRDTVTVPAGTFRTIVVQPVIQTSGLFGEGGRAEIHFSDDGHRRLVFMRADMPVVGTLTMSLEDYTPGTRVVASPPRSPAEPEPSTLTALPGAPAARASGPGSLHP